MNNGQTKMIEEFNSVVDRIETYAKSLKWCYSFFEDDMMKRVLDSSK